MIKNTQSKAIFLILGIDIIHYAHYYYSMSINALKAGNLVKLLEGISLLEDRDQEQIISAVDALDFVYEKTFSNGEVKNTGKVNKMTRLKS